MKNQLKIVVNGKSYEVEVGNLFASPIEVSVNGKAYTVDVEMPESVLPQSNVAPKAAQVIASVAAPVAPLRAPVASSVASSGGGADVRAPMPGIIRDIMVKPGQKVTTAQQICALEAMKMKSAIRSAREGVIASVDVSEGQRVAYGEVIVRYQ